MNKFGKVLTFATLIAGVAFATPGAMAYPLMTIDQPAVVDTTWDNTIVQPGIVDSTIVQPATLDSCGTTLVQPAVVDVCNPCATQTIVQPAMVDPCNTCGTLVQPALIDSTFVEPRRHLLNLDTPLGGVHLF